MDALCREILSYLILDQAMEEIHKLRAQISNIVQVNFPDASVGFVLNLQPPSGLQVSTYYHKSVNCWVSILLVTSSRC